MSRIKDKTSQLIEQARALFGRQVDALARQEAKVRELLSGVKQKLTGLKDNPRIKKMTEPISVFIRMVKAHFSGTHKLSGSTLGLILLALVYFLSPVDIIPDFLGFFGFADDLSVILAIFAKIKDEVADFLEWERTQI
ncbi:MAG: DUF1232 domain-containing protein [Algoriphagus sp.]|uniref:YkvA family protein n=1 Tax=Algoriphagus sp. TaxID=1872435 RepID=UPI00179EB168|nr:DUF1232 domain-containing protein [Algoriphagus sp.]NVJ85341.1 DUF1232 domain-containing protein [Algoriphagus sp.]